MEALHALRSEYEKNDTLAQLQRQVDDLDKECSMACAVISSQAKENRRLRRENMRLSAELEKRAHRSDL